MGRQEGHLKPCLKWAGAIWQGLPGTPGWLLTTALRTAAATVTLPATCPGPGRRPLQTCPYRWGNSTERLREHRPAHLGFRSSICIVGKPQTAPLEGAWASAAQTRHCPEGRLRPSLSEVTQGGGGGRIQVSVSANPFVHSAAHCMDVQGTRGPWDYPVGEWWGVCSGQAQHWTWRDLKVAVR